MDSIYTLLERHLTWQEGRPVPGYDPAVWRYDDFGNIMRFEDYGKRNTAYGWERDHRLPTAFGGLSVQANYRPLHWRQNASMGGHVGTFGRT